MMHIDSKLYVHDLIQLISHHVNMIFTHNTLTLSMIIKNALCKSYSISLSICAGISFFRTFDVRTRELTNSLSEKKSDCIFLRLPANIRYLHKCFIDYCINHYGYTFTSLFQLLISNYLVVEKINKSTFCCILNILNQYHWKCKCLITKTYNQYCSRAP